jgi:pterin-4a-carbinolamine dehydratase
MKTHPIGVIGKKDVRINKLIDKLYKRKALNE